MSRSKPETASTPTEFDEDSWEDMSDKTAPVEQTSRAESPATSGSVRSSTSPRKRKVGYRTVHVAASPRRPSIPPLDTKQSVPRQPIRSRTISIISKEEWVDGLYEGSLFVLRYTRDVVGHAVHLLRKPLSFLIFFWLFAFIMGRISHTLRAAFSPFCIIPGISSSSLCMPSIPHPVGKAKHKPQWADYPKLVDVQSATFEQLLDQSVGGKGLSLDIKKAEMATTDLVTLVRVSSLKSRDTLADSLIDFVDDAKRTGRGLQKLSAKVGGAVDGILAVNDYALHTIEDAYSRAPSAYSLRSLIPWSSRTPTEEIVTKTFSEAMSVLSTSMERLVVEAEVSFTNLDKLEERLTTLHEVVSREDSSISSAKSELLSELWTKVGGNRHALRGYDQHLKLLKDLGGYRKRALVHVVAALQTLRAMSDDMEDLRERVSAPELVGTRIPVEVHMKSIRGGLERLKEGRIKAKDREEEAVRRVLMVDSE